MQSQFTILLPSADRSLVFAIAIFTPIQCTLMWAHTSLLNKTHLNQFSHFCGSHQCEDADIQRDLHTHIWTNRAASRHYIYSNMQSTYVHLVHAVMNVVIAVIIISMVNTITLITKDVAVDGVDVCWCKEVKLRLLRTSRC